MANAATVTFSGRSIIWGRVKGNSVNEPLNIQWGDSTVTGSLNSDVNLFKPQTEARTAGTSSLYTTSFLADTYQVTGAITCAVGAKTITEVGLFDTTTASPSTTVAASLTASATVVTIGALGNFPTTGNYYAQVENEVVLVTGANSTTLTMTRGRMNSTSATHTSGVPFTLGGDGSMGAGLSGATTQQTATVGASVGGDLFLHADFAGIALNVSDSINFTIRDQISGA